MVWALQQGGQTVCTVGAYAVANGQAYMACGQTAEPLRGKGIGGRLIVQMANALAAEGKHPVFLCAPERVHFTFNNYKTIFTDSVYQVATSNSLYLSFASTIIGLILSFFIAWAVNELEKNGQSRMLSMLNMVSILLAYHFIFHL